MNSVEDVHVIERAEGCVPPVKLKEKGSVKHTIQCPFFTILPKEIIHRIVCCVTFYLLIEHEQL